MISNVVESHPLTLKDPEPFVRVEEYRDSSIGIAVRVWVDNDNFVNVKADILENIMKAFIKEGIEMPYPQVDVHVIK